MTITCNGKPLVLEDGARLQQTAHALMPSASVVIRNGFQTNEDVLLEDGDSITLIEKGVLPPQEVARFKEIVRKEDDRAFMFITEAPEALGEGFDRLAEKD